MSTLYQLTGQYKELLEMIEQGDMDPWLLKDTLEGMDGEIEIKADNYAKVIKELDGQASIIKAEIERLSNKKTALDGYIKTMKETLQKAMVVTGKKKIKTDLFSFNIQSNPPRLVVDGEVPEEFLIPQEPKVDNNRIKELLKTTDLPFAHLEQGESLRIR